MSATSRASDAMDMPHQHHPNRVEHRRVQIPIESARQFSHHARGNKYMCWLCVVLFKAVF